MLFYRIKNKFRFSIELQTFSEKHQLVNNLGFAYFILPLPYTYLIGWLCDWFIGLGLLFIILKVLNTKEAADHVPLPSGSVPTPIQEAFKVAKQE